MRYTSDPAEVRDTKCPKCQSPLIRTTDPVSEPVDHYKCVDCHHYWQPDVLWRPETDINAHLSNPIALPAAVDAVWGTNWKRDQDLRRRQS
jgi:hypothetical protein